MYKDLDYFCLLNAADPDHVLEIDIIFLCGNVPVYFFFLLDFCGLVPVKPLISCFYAPTSYSILLYRAVDPHPGG